MACSTCASSSGTTAWATATTSRPRSVRQHELGAPIRRIGLADHVSMHLEVGDQLAHRLLGHLGPFGKLADRSAAVVEVLEDIAVRSPHDTMATLSEACDNLVIEDQERITQEDTEIGRARAAGRARSGS